MLQDNSDNEPQQITRSESCSSHSRSSSNAGSYIVDYGPVRVRHRRSVSRTIATGRRSKDELLHGVDAMKRELRRIKNRVAARELKKARDQIEVDLLEEIKKLERQQYDLEEQHKELEDRKAHLNRALYNAKQAPLIPLITDINIPIIFGPQKRRDLMIDLRPLLEMLDEQPSTSDD
ncbi:unnamed protein product [Rotaria magnacalcarata]|uniref:BZIP domain-containing protein n=2 Tax=Rotaria magnacalcarata TaxID=392030 RepID=A0A816S9Q7_9BILA|nr:unnamed protein product [Rotaria magnacalcarata]CAF1665960.1 unnamed protein product [Rotaria magnacalcarata]CAF2048304.1 unnamed protein product [Rotaria magnacalcarata]CAF2062840.1 unnamed protein product [Rotaria magnacalcarata]CAF2078944.1 unnamed protein product [Rotaria magnacalcarata]